MLNETIWDRINEVIDDQGPVLASGTSTGESVETQGASKWANLRAILNHSNTEARKVLLEHIRVEMDKERTRQDRLLHRRIDKIGDGSIIKWIIENPEKVAAIIKIIMDLFGMSNP